MKTIINQVANPELVAYAIKPEHKNSNEFAITQAAKHNAKIDELSNQVYDSYIAKGVGIAIAAYRMKLYQERNYKTFTDFI